MGLPFTPPPPPLTAPHRVHYRFWSAHKKQRHLLYILCRRVTQEDWVLKFTEQPGLLQIIDCKAGATWKTFRDTNMTRTDKAGPQRWTAVSSLLGLVSTVQRRYVTPAKEPTHINCKMTRSLYQVPYFERTCAPKHALPIRSRLLYIWSKAVHLKCQHFWLRIFCLVQHLLRISVARQMSVFSSWAFYFFVIEPFYN